VLSTMHDIIEEARLKLVADFNGKLTMVNYDIAEDKITGDFM